MKRLFITLLFTAVSLPVLAEAAAKASAPSPAKGPVASATAPKIVASVNGEVITEEQLDRMYARLGTQMREQYNKNGGKQSYLENYLRKRLLVQEAIKSGFDKRPEVQADMDAARESALFDRYVRDVVAANVLAESEIRKYYDEHPEDFKTPEMIKVRHIVVIPNGAGPHPKSDEQAKELIQKVAAELRTQNALPPGTDAATANRLIADHFSNAARRYSEDASAASGGDLGWNPRGVFDKEFEDAAFNLRTNMVSGVIKSRFGYHLIYSDGKKPEGVEPYDEAKPKIREFLMTSHATDVVEAVARLTNELRTASKIRVYPENIH